MRRMYSEQELSKIIKEVFDAEVADGEFDETIANYVDAYLVEHPVDITALEGQDVALNSLDATGLITGGEIVEKMSGYSFTAGANDEKYELDHIYASIVKTGNKITFVCFLGVTTLDALSLGSGKTIGSFTIPSSIGEKLYPYTQGAFSTALSCSKVYGVSATYGGIDFVAIVTKVSNSQINFIISPAETSTANTKYMLRLEFTFLLSDSLIPEE